MLAPIKLYGTIALAVVLVTAGFWFKGVLAQRTAMMLQVAELQTAISVRDASIDQLKKLVTGNNKIIESMSLEAKALADSRDAAQSRVDQLTRDYQALSVQHQAPLPTGCEDAVREAARRAGAKP